MNYSPPETKFCDYAALPKGHPRPELFCEAGYESLGESLPIGEQIFEGDSPRNQAVTRK